MSSQAAYGTFPPQFKGQTINGKLCTLVLSDSAVGGNPQSTNRSLGVIRVQDVQDKPSIVEKWSVIGWNLNIRIALTIGQLPVWGKVGDLWAGLLINTPFRNTGGLEHASDWSTFAAAAGFPLPASPVALPANLSTFTKVWSGDDPIRVLAGTNFEPGESECSLLGVPFAFPLPITITSADYIQFVLILMPSVFGGAVDTVAGPSFGQSNEIQFAVKTAAFSVQYDDGR